jgi:hypothetical protein
MMSKKPGVRIGNLGRLATAFAAALFVAGSQAALAASPQPVHYYDAAYALSDDVQVAEASFTLTGTVVAVHYSQNTLDVQTSSGRVTVHVTPTTSISHKGETGSMSDLRPNQKVTITGVIRAGERIATSITIG